MQKQPDWSQDEFHDHEALLTGLLRRPIGGARVAERFIHEYGRLKALPRKQQRTLRKTWRMTLAGIALTFVLGAGLARPLPARAGTITVDGDGSVGTCSLADAITAANSNAPFGYCPTGDPGVDTIELSVDVTLSAALPDITSGIILNGNEHTIDANGGAFSVLRLSTPSGDLTLNQATVTGGNSFLGGGISNYYGTVNINDSTVSGNYAYSGGGIYNYQGTVYLNDSTVVANYAVDGGGILNTKYSTIILNNSTISGNSAFDNGGGLFNNYYGLVLSYNSTVSNNSAAVYGGAIANFKYGTLVLNNSTVSGNQAGVSGGIDNFLGAVNLYYSLVSGNTSTDFESVGSEIYNFGGGQIYADGYNLFGHSGEDNTAAFYYFSPSGSDINATSDGTNTPLGSILDTNLTNNGGPTLTHALVSGSPAIDAAGAGCGTKDQRGATRPTDGDGDTAAACDIGAVEIGQLQCGIQDNGEPTVYPFLSNNVRINITDDGNDLDCLRVTDIPWDHPNTTGTGPGLALMTGFYWMIDGLQTDASSEASPGYQFDLTLPFVGADGNSRVCRWLEGSGPGFGWNCGTDADNTPGTGEVARTGLSSFSDWAVGDNVGPTAVYLQNLSANSNGVSGPAAALGGVVAMVSGLLLWLRGKRKVTIKETQ